MDARAWAGAARCAASSGQTRGGNGNDRLSGGAATNSFNGGTDRANDRVAGEPATGIELFGP